MNCNQYDDSMQQCRHIFFEQNHVLMNISATNCRCLGLPSQQGINNKIKQMWWERRQRAIISFISLWIRTICNTQVLSHQDRGENFIGRIALACPVELCWIFAKGVNLKWGIVPYSRERCSKTDASTLRHKRALCHLLFRFSPPTTETAIFVKSHMKKWLFSLARGVLRASILYYKRVVQDTEFARR